MNYITLNEAALIHMIATNLIDETNAHERTRLAQQRAEDRFGITEVEFFTQHYSFEGADSIIEDLFA